MHFGHITSTGLYDHVLNIVEDQIERARIRTLERIQWTLDLENPPFTLNDHYYSSYRDKYLSRYKGARSVGDTLFPTAGDAYSYSYAHIDHVIGRGHSGRTERSGGDWS